MYYQTRSNQLKLQNMVGLFFGSDTGVTEEISHEIADAFENITVHEVCDATPQDFDDYNHIIMGLSTWYDGDLQSDWERFFETFKTINFSGKKVAFFGLGDQVGYAEYFIDGVGILAEVVLKNGGEIVGFWPVEGYRYTDSKAVIPSQSNFFYGLALDHDNESDLTPSRLHAWIQIVSHSFNT